MLFEIQLVQKIKLNRLYYMEGTNMKSGLRKFLSIGVVFAVLFAAAMPAFAQFPDTNGHWAAAEINKWVEKGIINGNPDGTYAPERPISRAEFSTLLSRLFNYIEKSNNSFTDVSSTAGYADAVSKAAAAGVILGNGGKFRPTAPVSRQEAALMLYRAFKLSIKEIAAANGYADAKEIGSWAKEAVGAVTEKGLMTGRPGNKFAPTANVTRAEAAKMIDNAVQDLKNVAGTYTGTIGKNLMVNTRDVILKDMVINGDLYLTPGVGDGSITLNNVKVKGKTVVMGGGENSIHLVNTTLTGALVIIKKDGKIRIVAEGSTVVSDVQLNSGAKLEESNLTGAGFGNIEIITVEPGQSIVLDGDFEEVTVEVAGAAIQVTEGKVGTLTVAKGAANANITIAAGASVTTLNANAAVQVSGQGAITTANINASGVVIAQRPANVNVSSGITATIAGTQTTGGTTPTTTTPSGGTPGGDTDNNTPTTSLSSVAFTKRGGGTIDAAVSGTTYTVDLSGASDSIYINGLKITSSPAADRLVVSDAANPVVGSNGTFNFLGNNSLIDAFFGVGFLFDGDVSVKTIKSILSGTITRNVAVYSGSTKIKDITLTIKISSGDTLGTQDLLSCYTISAAGGTITATLKSGNESKSVLTGTQFYQLLTRMITVPAGYTYSGVAVGTNGASYSAYTKDNVGILQALADQVEKGINNITLADLKAKETTVKVKASNPGNTDLEIVVAFK
jgi:hypothetical protein